ncbi:hypothetical protein M747DRAFT_60191 [Aspergillus niger ATCC 13496]|uniref:Uncharacterized protein n=1 Tax=Aspergillus niger ATCC 13496 TaxID=1353008 RepID=A0A370BVR2_ASPNG|nr:hypothetical protein M747DRAFT_60191 [Aspergillus niger ATCC 13496]
MPHTNSTTYWTLVILTEQPFLTRGHFEFTLCPEIQSEARRMCVEASFKTRALIEAEKRHLRLDARSTGFHTRCTAQSLYCSSTQIKIVMIILKLYDFSGLHC